MLYITFNKYNDLSRYKEFHVLLRIETNNQEIIKTIHFTLGTDLNFK